MAMAIFTSFWILLVAANLSGKSTCHYLLMIATTVFVVFRNGCMQSIIPPHKT